MAPNPIMIPRKQQRHQENARKPPSRATSISLISTSIVVALVSFHPWARRWLSSGCAAISLLTIYGSATGVRIFPSIPLWLLLLALNLAYAVSSTSWLLIGLFTPACWIFAFITCVWQFQFAAKFLRRRLRGLLKHLHLTRDMIALFNLPALEIDRDVDGLFVVRGLTLSISNLTIQAHGVELGLKVTRDIELALYVDELTIYLFRRIEIGNVYGNLKGGEIEMTLIDVDASPTGNSEGDDDSILNVDTPLLRAASVASSGLGLPRPSIMREMTGGIPLEDSSALSGLDAVKTLSTDEDEAHKQYMALLEEINQTSHIYQANERAKTDSDKSGFVLEDEKVVRAAICAKLQDMPSVPHPPTHSVKVSTLQNSSPPYVRNFMHRLPFLLRLLLMPISYFHPISIDAICVAGSGKWLTSLIQQNVFKHHPTLDAEVRRLERKVCGWLADANFCVELSDISALGQVPLRTIYDIVAYLKFADLTAYRTLLDNGHIQRVVHLGGADATFTIPSFLLPHHEHILPAPPTKEDEIQQEESVANADDAPEIVKEEQKLKEVKKDETQVIMSVHASLPASFDQSLLNFTAALVKATKVIEMEKEVDNVDETEFTLSRASTTTSLGGEGTASPSKNGFKTFTRGIRQNLKDNTMTSQGFKELARDLHQTTRDGMKKAVVGGVVNDRWIAKMVGKIAAKLERAQGDVGYSGGIPVSLKPYRAEGDLPPKILP